MTTTVKDIAKKANVSIATVSRVLNGDGSISHSTSRRVKEAAVSLKYKPIRRRRTRDESKPLKDCSVVLAMLGMDRSLEALPIIAMAVHGAESAISVAGGRMILANIPRLDEQYDSLKSNRIDGVIAKGAMIGDRIARSRPHLEACFGDAPTVWMLGRPRGCEGWGDVVGPNELAVGERAAHHLAKHGHQRVAYVFPRADHVAMERRWMGFELAAKSLGMSCHRFVPESSFLTDEPLSAAKSDMNEIQELIDQVLASDLRPTAVFVPADSVTVLAYRALAIRSVKVGTDLSVISANYEQSMVKGLYPDLTTINVHSEEVGRKAVSQLAWRMANPCEPFVEIGIEPSVVEGHSVQQL